MKQFEFTINNLMGMHARPAAVFVGKVRSLKSKISLSYNGKCIDAKNIIDILSLNIKQGSKVVISVEGYCEDKEVEELEQFCKNNL